jgi:ribosomal protein S18 acetylase RimI-like enzyme
VIELVRDRAMAMEAMLEALRTRANVGMRDFMEGAKSYEMVALANGSQPVGALMFKGDEVHVGIRPTYRGRWWSKRLRRVILGGLIEKHGCARTSVMKDNRSGIEFVERLGFKRSGENAAMIHYRMDTL